METLENRLQKRVHVSLYALLFLTTLLGLSVLLEGCSDTREAADEYVYEVRSGVALLLPKTIRHAGEVSLTRDALL